MDKLSTQIAERPLEPQQRPGSNPSLYGLAHQSDAWPDHRRARAWRGHPTWKASPMTYRFDGRPFVAVAAEPNITALGIHA